MLYRNLFKPVLFRMDPEKAHHLVIGGLGAGVRIPGTLTAMQSMYGIHSTPDMTTELFGLTFPGPVGLAAGLDKNAQAVAGLSASGFGFMEVGTVTPKPQPGNDQPRLFRLPSDRALINRMGFNNEGAWAMADRLRHLVDHPIPLAINIGKNKVTPNEQAANDYKACISELYTYADFFVVNISSPNTPDLRNLQHGNELKELLAEVMQEMDAQARNHGIAKSVLVKIAPDVSDAELEYMVETIRQSGAAGIIATNTTLSRDGLTHDSAGETGGLSGRPLTERSTEIISRVYRQTEGKLPIIGCGGIFSSEDAYDKIKAGSSLVEIYTSFIYEGPQITRRLHNGIRELMQRDGFAHISEAVGAAHR
ncbi:quinone-dependent dihydroorotate dehydrogenase [Paenibacillus campi]|uniref:quinone-dependent dihydroorotate dehydrogenase n=1 Tax=Paenibacillus campi TaxID=3106031 RepID=UPI002AFE8936|nr:quinone-dependent dihydroorotate dehydrogenase [Paenibacillus sp. SGZ-1009]